MEELSRRFILPQSHLQSARRTSAVGCSLSMGQTSQINGQQPLLINPLASFRVRMYGTFLRLILSPQLTALQSLNMPVLVRVDNVTYSLLGYPYFINVTSNLTNTIITPTQTQLISEAGPMQFNLTFLNPIEV
jgi:hypothetical protein